ncbi:hypothetical protein AC578_1662 [Pseudocercospora eumusae]|uniref:Uncharacterized protein n=1 Tax=Pseudocercospora eumusae TaxID=321146 RepID=A0A139HLW1_9PEZI|nr:hypothetical protein AC578_1662 [Pseudocercospora eumusae]
MVVFRVSTEGHGRVLGHHAQLRGPSVSDSYPTMHLNLPLKKSHNDCAASEYRVQAKQSPQVLSSITNRGIEVDRAYFKSLVILAKQKCNYAS